MPTVYTASCAMCAKPFRTRRLNGNAYCARCIRQERDIERGYGKQQCGDYTCVFCDATVQDTTHFTVVIEGELYPADYDCLLNNASETSRSCGIRHELANRFASRPRCGRCRIEETRMMLDYETLMAEPFHPDLAHHLIEHEQLGLVLHHRW